jgi:enediyne biosynthesis protein E4
MKKIILLVLAIILIGAAYILYSLYGDTQDPYVQACDYTVPESEIPTFTEVAISFTHQFNDQTDLPMMAGALIDVDDDGIDEIFVGGGANQKDGLFQYDGAAFRDISDQLPPIESGKSITLGAVSFDLDEDNDVDLLITRKEGVFFLENQEGRFIPKRLNIEVNEKSTPLSLTLGDYDRDGDADIFVSAYIKVELMEGQTIFNKSDYGASSILLRNDGGLQFSDVTSEAGLEYVHNTFQAVMVDLTNNGWLDLVVAYDTGRPKIYENKEGKYVEVPTPLSGKYSYPMGIGIGDYNNDGYMDMFFSNTGSTVPEFMVRGDLTEDQELIKDWMLFENKGNMTFEDAARKAKVADFEFSWGAIFEDFNLDGKQDLAVAENYIAFPANKLFKLPCRLLVQRGDGTFAAVEEQAHAENKHYAITPMTSDFNADGYPDLVYTNLDGPLRVLINDGGKSNYLKVRFPEQAHYVGAIVKVSTTNKSMTDSYIIGEGLCSDNSNVLTFGLGEETKIDSLVIRYVDGSREIRTALDSNQTIVAEKTKVP